MSTANFWPRNKKRALTLTSGGFNDVRIPSLSGSTLLTPHTKLIASKYIIDY